MFNEKNISLKMSGFSQTFSFLFFDPYKISFLCILLLLWCLVSLTPEVLSTIGRSCPNLCVLDVRTCQQVDNKIVRDVGASMSQNRLLQLGGSHVKLGDV